MKISPPKAHTAPTNISPEMLFNELILFNKRRLLDKCQNYIAGAN